MRLKNEMTESKKVGFAWKHSDNKSKFIYKGIKLCPKTK